MAPLSVSAASRQGTPTPHGRRLLLALLGSPLAWTVHLLAAYLVVTLWCSSGWAGADLTIGILTLICAAAAIASGVLAFRLWREGQRALLTDEEPGAPESWDSRMGERGARAVFLAVLGLFMGGLFACLIVLQGLPPLYTPTCPLMTSP
jgi:hypothetical protein